MNKTRILIVDDEPDICQLLKITLERMQLLVDTAENVKQALNYLEHNEYQLCLTDMRLPDGSGQTLVSWIEQHKPATPIAVLTAYGSMETAVNALKAGAFDFISKPVNIHVLRQLVHTALKLSEPQQAEHTAPINRPKGALRAPHKSFNGDSAAIRAVRQKIDKLAKSQAPVFIKGETGSGKELAARLIHQSGPRSHAPFVTVNCSAILDKSLYTAFFGQEKNPDLNIDTNTPGYLQKAHGGTLYLNEVSELPQSTQIKLLRALQERSIEPLGALQPTNIDIRLISASHKDLVELIEAGKFRRDFFYRINVIELAIPPLRERQADLQEICQSILQRIGQQQDDKLNTLTDKALEQLKNYTFPGNVRELVNILERSAALTEETSIDVDDLAFLSIEKKLTQNGTAETLAPIPEQSLDDYISTIERKAIVAALEKSGQNKTQAAKILGISFRALRYKLKKLDID